VDVFAHAVRTYQAVEDLINDPGSHLPTVAEAIIEHFRAEERQALVKWAALLHVLEERAQPWEHIGDRLKLSRKQSDAVKTLLAHYRGAFELAILEAEGRLTLRMVHSWCKEVGDSLLGIYVLVLGHAIARGQGPTSEPGITSLGQLAAHVWELYRRHILPVMTAPRLVTGDDLQQIFHLTPGPRFKVLLDELEVAQVEGHIRTRAEALQWVAGQVE
jgi:poly(A) polymerase